ncbi:Fur family transcriptional regulator [Tropicimonas marinistellae]|uniref:Fur family transcriptional regulator n=1 Tax=Tropicimonas marinistellae TaxID=1739787 RepID=UPI0008347C71|nr:Fur family transcriptional regulator [Tropicimonas marinistellae]
MGDVAVGEHRPPLCVEGMISGAESYCAKHGLRFTDSRRRVLELLLEAPKAVGAYELLEQLRREKRGAQPPAVYRALDFLVAHGFVHKIDRLSAFVACAHPHEDHLPVFMVCNRCESVTELCSSQPTDFLDAAAREVGFLLEETVVEAFGICTRCKEAKQPA